VLQTGQQRGDPLVQLVGRGTEVVDLVEIVPADYPRLMNAEWSAQPNFPTSTRI
jgi:hypothetical protein